MTIKRLREITGLSMEGFCKKYNIPQDTMESWEQEREEPPVYVTKLLEKVITELDYKVFFKEK